MKRIAVIGTSGSGKSTLASVLAARLDLPRIASDPFYWEQGWIPASAAVVRQRLTDALAGDCWVIDGNCITDRDVVWGKADTILWLDYPLPLILRRVCGRNLRWCITQEQTWSGNRMTLRRAWSGIRHTLRTYREKRAAYPGYFAEYPHLTVIHIRTPQELTQWLVTSVITQC